MTQDIHTGAGAQPAPALQPEALRIAMHLRQRAQLGCAGNPDTLSAAGANALERQHAELLAARAEAKHWRCNHDNVAARLRVFTQRPDLPKELADRLPWYSELVRLQAVEAQLSAIGAGRVESLRKREQKEFAEVVAMMTAIGFGVEPADAEAALPSILQACAATEACAALQAAPPAPTEPRHEAAAILEAIAQEPPINGNTIAQDRVLKAASTLRSAAPPAPAGVAVPAHDCCNSWFTSLSEGRQSVLRDDKWMLAHAAFDAGRAALAAAPALAVAVPVEVDLPDVEDMAHSAVQEALSYGVSHDVFHRWMRAVMDKTVQALAAAPAQEHATQLAGLGQGFEPTAYFGLAAEQIDKLRTSGLKPEEIAGEDPAAQLNRVRELVWWFARFADGHANPKWLRGHAFELAYYIACMDVKRGIDLKPIWDAAYKEGAMISPAERGMLERIGFIPAAPIQAQEDARDGLTQAARDVLAERARQIGAEGYEPEADDDYESAELAAASATYALLATGADEWRVDDHWPWAMHSLKKTDARRMMVKSAALALAEIERLDRAAARAAQGGAA